MVNHRLRINVRPAGAPGGDSLARLLARRKGVRTRSNCPLLTERQILAWCDAHFVRTGRWPRHLSGPIVGAPGETWLAVDTALRKGHRGLPGGDSLFLLLRRHRNIPGPRSSARRRERGAGSRAIIRLNLSAELLERYGRGELTIAQVAAKCGVGIATAARELKRAGAKSCGPGRPARTPEHARILRLYRRGHTLSAVARAVGWSPYRVRGLLLRIGVTLRPQGEAPALGLTPSGRVRFGRRLRKRRLACGLTQKQLAARCGIHALAVTVLEKGRFSPLRRTVLRLAEALRVRPEMLLGRRKITLRDDAGHPGG